MFGEARYDTEHEVTLFNPTLRALAAAPYEIDFFYRSTPVSHRPSLPRSTGWHILFEICERFYDCRRIYLAVKKVFKVIIPPLLRKYPRND